jgi:hypothetical protein
MRAYKCVHTFVDLFLTLFAFDPPLYPHIGSKTLSTSASITVPNTNAVDRTPTLSTYLPILGDQNGLLASIDQLSVHNYPFSSHHDGCDMRKILGDFNSQVVLRGSKVGWAARETTATTANARVGVGMRLPIHHGSV